MCPRPRTGKSVAAGGGRQGWGGVRGYAEGDYLWAQGFLGEDDENVLRLTVVRIH